MAIRPHAAGSSARSHSDTRMRSGGSTARGTELALPLSNAKGPVGGIFGGRDPFAEFGADPFAGGFGMGGAMMKQFEDLSRGMMRDFGGPGGGHNGLGGGSMPGGAQYSCQTFAMSSVMGADGKMHTERYVSSDVGNRAQNIRESQQAYSNSTTGIDKMGLERQLGSRGRKMVKERDRFSQEERSTEMYRGMDESGRSAFERDFGAHAHHLPQHPPFNGAAMLGSGGAGLRGGGRPASIGSGQRALQDRRRR